jgi:hypothetical protein
MGAVKSAVPSAVAPSTENSVRILTEPQLGPYAPMTGSSVVPAVPNVGMPGDAPGQPGYGRAADTAGERDSGSNGAPSVPRMNGILFRAAEIDAHYQSQAQDVDPYAKVNNPATRGMWTRIQMFLNGIATSQDTDNAGWKARHPQQRTSVMRNALPARGIGYAPEIFTPHQMPQSDNTYKYPPSTGTQPYGTGVLNADSYGAGQTAGGVGGNNYTPVPGPPATTSTASADIAAGRGMPTWG